MHTRSEIVNQERSAAVQWDDNYFKLCNFESFSIEGYVIGSDFVSCSFSNVDWYWGLFSGSNFISCTFRDCIFRGSSFPQPIR
jgi:uncharacterized protein YjbI with pentapeptide repeats